MSASSRLFKTRIYEQFARVGKAVAAPGRLELLDLLCQGPRTVEALAREAGLSVANASRHLQVLRAARLVETTKHGLYVEYRLADPQVGAFFGALRRLAETRLAEVDQATRAFLRARDAMEAVDDRELLRRVRSGEVTLLDVRPPEEYRAGHIPGALSVPLADLRRRLTELQKSRDIVAYCRGPYCVMALEAEAMLRENGFRAHRMVHGVTDWRARGWRIETGARRGHARTTRAVVES